MVKLVLIIGAGAVVKMTVGQELMKITNLRLSIITWWLNLSLKFLGNLSEIQYLNYVKLFGKQERIIELEMNKQ